MVSLKKNNRWKIIVLATLFNLSLEYAFRGYAQFFTRPLLILFLFGTYFAIYTILEDLIVRYKITNLQLVLSIWPLGLIPMAFGTGLVFNDPQFLGINWVNLLFVELLWWGILQAILTFYFANRLVARDWNHPCLGKLGWTLCLTYIIGSFTFTKFVVPPTSFPSLLGFGSFLLLLIGPTIFLFFDLPKNIKRQRRIWQFVPSATLDILSFGSLLIFLFLGTYFGGYQTFNQASSSFINPISRFIIIRWTFIYSFVFLLYRWKKGEITI